MHKKHIFLRVFSKITIFACVFCVFFISPVFATLPAGYTELEYIESTGTQYIDTGINTNENIKLEVVFDPTTVSTTYRTLIACRISANSQAISQAYISGGTYMDFGDNSENGGLNKNTVPKQGQWNTIIQDKSQGSVNGYVQPYLSTQTTNFTTVAHMYMFARNNINKSGQTVNVSNYADAKIKTAKIWDNGVFVRNFIPAKRDSDGEIGMYDTVSGTFFTNQGTGDFIAGPIAHCKTFGTDGITCTACESGYKLGSTGGCVGVIEIATTKMVDDEFAAAEAKLATTVQTIESVVSRTITQTGQIATLHETKQTRPDESCPANMKCLLVQDEDGTPHWYPIIEP